MLRKSVSPLIMLILLPALTITGMNSQAQGPAKQTLDERLGVDDGAALAILFGANMRGNLETCD